MSSVLKIFTTCGRDIPWTRGLAIAMMLLFANGEVSASDERILQQTLRDLPEVYLADIPKDKREILLTSLSRQKEDHLSNSHDWVHYFSDNGREIAASSMFWLKLLPREGKTPLVFVHMAKPMANRKAPARDQTFVLERVGKDWKDVTASVIPKEVDLSLHFSPRRDLPVIKVKTWERIQLQQGQGEGYMIGSRLFDLIWRDGAFHLEKADEGSR
jgi:hypothetical protein